MIHSPNLLVARLLQPPVKRTVCFLIVRFTFQPATAKFCKKREGTNFSMTGGIYAIGCYWYIG